MLSHFRRWNQLYLETPIGIGYRVYITIFYYLFCQTWPWAGSVDIFIVLDAAIMPIENAHFPLEICSYIFYLKSVQLHWTRYTRIRYVKNKHVKNLTHYTVSAEFYVMFLELCRGLELKFKSKVYVTLKKDTLCLQFRHKLFVSIKTNSLNVHSSMNFSK